MLEYLELPFVQRGLVEVALLSIAAAAVGTWIVLRGLAFFSHAVGTAAFPGLVVADGLGFAAPLGAAAAAMLFATGLAGATRGEDERGRAAATALLLVGALATGVILASDVFGSSSRLETLLFGSLLLVGPADIALAAAVAALALISSAALGPRWLARGFDPAGPAGVRVGATEAVLPLLVGLVSVAALSAVGALLVSALVVLPAATARLVTRRMLSWQLTTLALALAQGVAGVLVSLELNAPPGATIAVLGGAAFAAVALMQTTRRTAPLARRGGWVAAAAILAAAAGAVGCGPDDASGRQPRVVATTPLIADLVERVAGREVEVQSLIDPNADPHDYEPRPDDVQAIAAADLVFASGAGLDDWISAALRDSGSAAELVDLSGSIPVRLPDPGGDGIDPHWFHNPRNVEAAVSRITGEAAGLAPRARRPIERRGRRYSAAVGRLNAGIRACMGAIPAADRLLITDHDAFGYLARRYRIEVIGAVIPAVTTQAQPSPDELAELRRLIERLDVAAVFPEASAGGDLARAIARETGAELGQELYSDSLGPPGSPGQSYLGMMAANADALMRGFTDGARGCAGVRTSP